MIKTFGKTIINSINAINNSNNKINMDCVLRIFIGI